jgi:hypothetical protein
MGFIIGFPILLLTTIAFIIFYAITKKKIALIGICSIWGFAFLIVVTGLINDYYSQPIRLTKTEIIGDYRIDTNFFTGKNAKWQCDHYRFTITPTDTIIFYVTNKEIIIKTYKEKIVYSSGPPDMWKVQNGTAYHVLKYPPTLFRGHKKFYYVFKSDYYGNMFFRKVDK